jgi:hypothetical protein
LEELHYFGPDESDQAKTYIPPPGFQHGCVAARSLRRSKNEIEMILIARPSALFKYTIYFKGLSRIETKRGRCFFIDSIPLRGTIKKEIQMVQRVRQVVHL